MYYYYWLENPSGCMNSSRRPDTAVMRLRTFDVLPKQFRSNNVNSIANEIQPFDAY